MFVERKPIDAGLDRVNWSVSGNVSRCSRETSHGARGKRLTALEGNDGSTVPDVFVVDDGDIDRDSLEVSTQLRRREHGRDGVVDAETLEFAIGLRCHNQEYG
ncbi:hypothetical protein C446_14064 [Halobiforma nitratireducens JCM 10879]|uniref:Uncharacterized protein n=1 Tax=Halobiforma nitratireducens JCM 10879 TaxID=1227454 RepID=M0LIK9_9EURY|nr:hypothetical protein C446_14064 [Halobiforma nitratireducens JCM 10879]